MSTAENIEQLQKAGFPNPRAQAIAKVVENTNQETIRNLATKEDLNTLRVELKGDMSTLRAELKGEMSTLRADMSTLRAELKGEMNALRAEMSDRITSQTRWLVSTIIASQVAMTAILALVITLT